MKRWIAIWALVVSGVALSGGLAGAQDGVNPRALEDLKAFQQKFEEGDALFSRKQYAEAATVLADAHALYLRAERRDSNVGGTRISLKPGTFAALRRYGHGMGPNGGLGLKPTGTVEGSVASLHTASNEMRLDASILSGAEKGPLGTLFKEPELEELTERALESVMSGLYGPVSALKLPVPDDEWRSVVLWSRRAELILEHALRKYPEWRTSTHNWSRNNDNLSPTGDQALADIKAKLAEAEPEYARIEADFKNAPPRRVADSLKYDLETLNGAIGGVNQNGWVLWNLARDVYLSKEYLSVRRKNLAPLYAEEGKMMPADALKPLEDKIAELTGAIDKNATRWTFPAGKTRNAAIEARAAQGVKSRIPGATVVRAALDDANWTIVKNDLGLPRKRTRAVLVLVKVPGQKWPWLVRGYYEQEYAGGGTYNSGGSFGHNEIRVQSAN